MPKQIFVRRFPQEMFQQIVNKRCKIRVTEGQIRIEVSQAYQLEDLLAKINAANRHAEINTGTAVGCELLPNF